MDELCALFDAVGERREYDKTVLPLYPELEPAQVPPMPRLTGDRHADAKMLIKAYKAACHSWYGRRPRVDRKATFRMLHAVMAFRKTSVRSAYAWAAFRLKQWQLSENSRKPPKIDYVFSKSVVEKHADYFNAMSASYDVLNRVVLTPSHRELVRRWERCQRALGSPKLGPSGVGHDARIVSEILPKDLYTQLMRQAAKERSNLQADMTRRLAAGEWIW